MAKQVKEFNVVVNPDGASFKGDIFYLVNDSVNADYTKGSSIFGFSIFPADSLSVLVGKITDAIKSLEGIS